jgi:hypothetical protein
MDALWIIGLVGAICALIWVADRLEQNPLDEAIKEAQEWDKRQKKLDQILTRNEKQDW